VLHGDASLFARRDSIELSWAIMDPIIAGWENGDMPPLPMYAPGTWGPEEADAFIAHDRRQWLRGKKL
jgi:glucose-6-phosphate 1-dehydrogenase